MAKKTYIVNHRKLNLNVKLEGQDEPKFQRVPLGFEVSMDEAHAKGLIKAGKLKLKTGSKKATVVEDSKEDKA